MLNFDKLVVPIECPRCKFPNLASMREIRFGLSILCRGCKIELRLQPVNGGAAKAKRALENFQTSLSTKITIEL